MRELAENVGVSKAALYYYFSDKEQLFVEILSQFQNEIQSQFEKIFETIPNLHLQLIEILRYIDQQSTAKKQLIWYLRHDVWQLSDEKALRLVHQYHDGFVDTLEKMFRNAIDRDEIKPIDPNTLAWAFLGMVYPFVNTMRNYQQMEQNWTKDVIEVFLEGVYARD